MTSGNPGTDDEDDDVLTLSGFVKKAKALASKNAAKTRSEQAFRASSSGAEPLNSEAAEEYSVGDSRRGITALVTKEGICEREDEGQDAADSDVPDDDYAGVGGAAGFTVQGQGAAAEKFVNGMAGFSDNHGGVFAKNQVQPAEHASSSGTKGPLKSLSKPLKRSRTSSLVDAFTKGHAKERSRKGGKRAPRQVRRRRHDDMAYEGDLEWDVLMGDPEQVADWSALLEKDRFGRCRSRDGQPSSAESFPGEVAAIAAGLKARAPGPSERIHFKESMKRRGGLQEYLDCRNKILELWEKDVRRILTVEDCLMNLHLPADGSSRSILIHEIHEFLEVHGCINIGLAVKGGNNLLSINEKIHCGRSDVAELLGSTGLGKDGNVVDDAEKEAAFILGQIRGEPEKSSSRLPVLSVVGNGFVEGLLGDSKTEGNGATALPHLYASITSTSGGIVPMDIDVTSTPCLDLGTIESEGVNDYVLAQRTPEWDVGPVVLQNRAAGDYTTPAGPHYADACEQRLEALHCSANREQQLDIESLQASSRCMVDAPDQVNSLSVGDGADVRSAEVLQCLRKDALKVATGMASHSDFLNRIPSSNRGAVVGVQRKTVIVIGAGPAGLSAARHLQRMCFNVVVLEARGRVGGRVYTDRSTFSAPVDLGASIITGVEADFAAERRADPSALLCKQLGLELTTLRGDCPLYDSVTGLKVPRDLDAALEAEYNSLLDDTVALVANNGEAGMQMSLGEGLEHLLQERRTSRQQPADEGPSVSGVDVSGNDLRKSVNMEGLDVLPPSEIFPQAAEGMTVCQGDCATLKLSSTDPEQGVDITGGWPTSCHPAGSLKHNVQSNYHGLGLEHEAFSQLERRIMDWHFANLEYGCAAELSQVSLPYWNQDDVYGGFGGAHCMIKGGYSSIMESLGETIDVRLENVVTSITYRGKEGKYKGELNREVKVQTAKGEVFVGDAALITIPLGCLKAETIHFQPCLPDWKTASVKRLGFGLLNKLVMEFPSVFWDETVDYFGAAAESTEVRGKCFMFWNLKRTSGMPILVALVVGKASYEGEKNSKLDMLTHALSVLRKLFGEEKVPEPRASALTSWGSDPFSRGAYSYVALGASGEDYDILARPVENCLFFAGEGTCKEHPDTVGGAMISGLREGIRIFNILENRGDSTAEAEAMAAAQRQTDSERNEVRDMVKRLSAAELSNALRADGGPLHGEQKPLSRSDLLKDMFGRAKTTAGRLFLAKQMLQLPVPALRAFAGTKLGLTLLNNWILDSMGKDGTQLLRMCVRLLLLVATDLLCIRQSGIGRTVKEKVCVHTSRDIRAVAGQLVKMWIEVHNKEKATYGTQKLYKKQNLTAGVMKTKGKGVKLLSNFGKTGADASAIPETKSTSTDDGTPVNQSRQEIDVDEVTDLDAGGHFGKAAGAEARERALSEMEAAALAAAEAAQAAARAAAEAYAKAEAERVALPLLPRIVSFQKFSKQEQLTVKDELLDRKRKKWSDGVKLGNKQLYSPASCPIDFSGANRMKSSIKEHRVSSVDRGQTPLATTCTLIAKNQASVEQILDPLGQSLISAVDSSGEEPIQAEGFQADGQPDTCNTVETSSPAQAVCNNSRVDMGEPHASGELSEVEAGHGKLLRSSEQSKDIADSGPSYVDMKLQDDHVKDSKLQHHPSRPQHGHPRSQPHEQSRLPKEHSKSQEDLSRSLNDQNLKKAVAEYIGHLLMPLYKSRKIRKEDYKAILRSATAKVIERRSGSEVQDVSEFLNVKRKNKIRSLIDKYIERYLGGQS